MKYVAFLFLSIFLVACDGYEYDRDSDSDGDSGSTQSFTSSELTSKILFSDSLQSSNVDTGYILRFENSSELEQILIKTDNTALSGDYDWTISSGDLQVTYPLGVVCTTTKTNDNNSEYQTSANCTGGTPVNAIIENSLVRPLSLQTTDFASKEITIDLGNNQEEVIQYNSDANSFTLTEKNNGQASNPESGSLNLSNYTNVLRLSFPSDSSYRLLVLLDDNLSSGKLLELHYNSNNALTKIRFISSSNDNWEVNKEIIVIATENT